MSIGFAYTRALLGGPVTQHQSREPFYQELPKGFLHQQKHSIPVHSMRLSKMRMYWSCAPTAISFGLTCIKNKKYWELSRCAPRYAKVSGKQDSPC